jgi:hypothetical protein
VLVHGNDQWLVSFARRSTAALGRPTLIPTLELGVRPPSGLDEATSPWVLFRSRSHAASDGWIDERLDAWPPGQTHAGSATQLRLLRG